MDNPYFLHSFIMNDMEKVLKLILVLMTALPLLPVSCVSVPERRLLVQDLIEEGQLQMDEGRFEEAVITFTRAREGAVDIGDVVLEARALQALGETYNSTFFYEDGLFFSDSASRMAFVLCDTLLIESSLAQVAKSYTGLGYYQEADSLYQVLLSSGYSSNFESRILSERAFLAARFFDDFPRAIALYEEALAINASFARYEHWFAYAYCLAATGRVTEADSIMEEMRFAGFERSGPFQEWMSHLTALRGDYRSAYSLLDEASSLQRNGILRISRQSMIKAQREYFELQSRQAQAHERARRIRSVFGWAILLVILVAAVIWFYRYDRRRELERASLLDWASNMENQMNELSVSQAKLRNDYAQLYRSYFQQIGRINDIVANSPSKEKGVYFQLRQLIKNIRLDKRGQKQFEAMMNKDLENIMLHFRDDFPNCQEDTYRFVSYVFAGFDAPTIRVLMGFSSDAAVYTKKSGIKKSVLSSDSPRRDWYLMFL